MTEERDPPRAPETRAFKLPKPFTRARGGCARVR